ncbi:hypothetical protein [Chryseobacterium paridis]|uniref:Uncharacterized protein n=1 Tax=Chryseobacterium paridis TaxID=2800328 RepID=A0ABS1FY38_9FLAO|nr:hypothetical protein [Chryseobacterium paridis]MBK1897314.1 hypothetical protein [Chryseobacterium paridis]
MVLSYNSLSLYLQVVINLTLLTGLILLVRNGIKTMEVIMLFLSGEFALELTDLVDRLLKLNTLNTYNYALSQFLGLVLLTEIYSRYFLKVPAFVKWIISGYAMIFLVINILNIYHGRAVTFYSNIISSIIICSFAATYCIKILQKGKVEKSLFIVNIFVFLFFSVECLISTTFNFLVTNHLEWVAPIWLFRGVLLWCFYLAFINLGCRSGKIRAW